MSDKLKSDLLKHVKVPTEKEVREWRETSLQNVALFQVALCDLALKALTRPVPDPEPQEGLRVALELCALVRPGMGREVFAKANEASKILAALASPKADHKTDGMTDADVDAWLSYALAGIDMTPDERASLKEVCAQAKRCNALERERDEVHCGFLVEASRHKRTEAERDALKGQLAGPDERDALLRWGNRVEAERDALAKQVDSLESLIGDVQAKCMDDEILEYIQTALAKSQPALVPAPEKYAAVLDEMLHGSQPAEKCKDCGESRLIEVGSVYGAGARYEDCPTCKPAEKEKP